jgi:hypothetical protein
MLASVFRGRSGDGPDRAVLAQFAVHMPATSPRRQPVSNSSSSSNANRSPSVSHACQNHVISASLNTRSRACGAVGLYMPTAGLMAILRCSTSQENSFDSAAPIARARVSLAPYGAALGQEHQSGALVLKGHGYDDVCLGRNGYQGWPECGPFDAVIVTAALL